MHDTQTFALLVLLVSAAGLLAVVSNRLSQRIRVPAPALFLAAAAIAVRVVPDLHAPPQRAVERIVTVALLCILLDGGMHIGWTRLRAAAAPVALVGVLGTFLTTAGTALLLHLAFGFEWYLAVLLGTAVAPTDPAVVFSVLGQREVAGRSGTVLEGESGANDPVGIALMTSLLAAGGLSAGAFAGVSAEFALQMVVGAAAGLLGGRGMLLASRRLALPNEALYPLRTLASAFAVYGLATLAHGSGFLAVFVVGVVLGDERAPYKREVERFTAALASLGEIVAFVVLGLTVELDVLARTDVWVPGLVVGVVLAGVIRPVLVGLCLLPAGLARGEQGFILFAGLKGAVPILLGSFLLAEQVPGAERLYGIVVVVVAFSVVVQGSLVPAVAHLLRVPMRVVPPEPWALGVRLRDEPQDAHLVTIQPGAPADGCTVESLPGDVWVSLVVREHELLGVRPDTRLAAGDEVLLLADGELREDLTAAFERPVGP